MKLLDLYSLILKFCGFSVDDNGFISTEVGDQKDPAFINGLRMVLPTNELLRRFDPKEHIVFHPLTENILRGESEVIQKLKKSLNIKINFTIGMISQELLRIVASPALHAKLTPEQHEILQHVKDCDEKSVINFTSVMVSRIKADAERAFANIYLKRGGTYKDKRYSRVGIVTFPIYADLDDDKIDKIRVKDNETYRQLFKFMFPNVEKLEEYNFGSDSTVAPYLEALMRAAANVASRLNDLILLYKDHIEDAEALLFESDWIESFMDLNAFVPEVRRIPVQAGNDGTLHVTEAVQETSSMASAARQQLQQQQLNSPQMMPVYPGMAPAPAPTEVKKTRRGIDFKSLIESNPGFAAVPNPLAPQMMMQQMQYNQNMDANRVPSWATAPQQMQMYPTPQGQMYPGMQPGMPMNGQVVMTQAGPMMIMPNGQMVPVQMQNNVPPWMGAPAPGFR